MARTFHRKEPMAAISEINVTPLIDLAFALLIIFMITTPLMEQKIDLELALESEKPQTEAKPKLQKVSINRDGNYFWGSERVSLDQLAQRLENLGDDVDPPVISVRADRRIEYQKVITLIDLIKSNKLTKISLDTRVE